MSSHAESLFNHEFGQNELLFGVAVNRATQAQEGLEGTTSVYYNDSGGTVTIDIENDDLLFEFISKVKNHGTGLSPQEVTAIVVEMTPSVDITGAYHNNRATTLGQALADPVECVDRALAFEAALTMLGLADSAVMLISVDRYSNGSSSTHADLIFTKGADRFVAITMGARAGEIVTFEEYETKYLQEREDLDLGKREIKHGWGHSYFQKP